MRLRINGVVILVGIKIALRVCGDLGLNFKISAIGTFKRISLHNRGAILANYFFTLRAGILREIQPNVIPQRGADHRVRNSGITAGRINNSFIRRQ